MDRLAVIFFGSCLFVGGILGLCDCVLSRLLVVLYSLGVAITTVSVVVTISESISSISELSV